MSENPIAVSKIRIYTGILSCLYERFAGRKLSVLQCGGNVMIIISYDIADDKRRARFNKYIRKFGHRLQYSVYEIDNSERILNNIMADINNKWLKEFEQTDSVYVFKTGNSCQIYKYGYAGNEDEELLIVK